MHSDHAPALEIHNLGFHYGNRKILTDISLAINQGVLCGLLGPNGSGKTTLFKCCLNFQKASSGTILINGQPTQRLSPARLSRLVSYVPQEHRASFPFPVRDLVYMGRNPLMSKLFNFGAEHWNATQHALDLLGIGSLANSIYSSLSGGQKQLALIARAVAQQAPLMLLDEPTSALDFQNQIEVWKTLRCLAKAGFTLVVCCHDPNHILWFCDQAILLKNGRILKSGKPDSVINPDTLKQLYGSICEREELADGLPVVCPAAHILSEPVDNID